MQETELLDTAGEGDLADCLWQSQSIPGDTEDPVNGPVAESRLLYSLEGEELLPLCSCYKINVKLQQVRSVHIYKGRERLPLTDAH